MITFAQPIWIGIGAAATAGLLGLSVWADRQRQAALRQVVAPHLLAPLTASLSIGRRRFKRALLLGAVFLVCTALARPQAGFRFEEVKRQGADVLFAVDTSRSMLARDLRPDRLTRAKLAVSDLSQRLASDRIGLIAFAGEAFLQCPLTLDHGVFRESLDALDTQIIPRGGTNLAAAIQSARAALSTEPRNRKLLILFTDGEELDGEGVAAAQAAAQEGLRIFTVGVGTASGDLIPVPSEAGGETLLSDGSGSPVHSRLDEKTLRRIAEVSGGSYQALGERGEGLDALYAQHLGNLPKHELAAQLERVPTERFVWPLGLALLCLLAEPLLGERRRARVATTWSWLRRLHLAPAAATSLIAILFLSGPAQASPRRAEAAYQRGDYHAALKEYSQDATHGSEHPELRFNAGDAAYRSGDFAQAAGSFEKAITEAKRRAKPDLQEQAYYNLGNAQFRQGERSLSTNREQTRAAWQQAIKSYESALQSKPSDGDARFNLELTKQRLAQLDEKPPQNDQKQPSPSGGKKQPQDAQKQSQQSQQSAGDSSKSDTKDQGKASAHNQGNGQGNGPGNDQSKGSSSGDKGPPPKQAQGQSGSKQSGSQQPGQPDQKPQSAQNANGQQGKNQSQAQGMNAQETRSRGPEGTNPDALSKEDAAALLDSLKDEGRSMPAAAMQAGRPVQEPEPGKDW